MLHTDEHLVHVMLVCRVLVLPRPLLLGQPLLSLLLPPLGTPQLLILQMHELSGTSTLGGGRVIVVS